MMTSPPPSPTSLIERDFILYINAIHQADMECLLSSESAITSQYGLTICLQTLVDFNPRLAAKLFSDPTDVLEHFDAAVVTHQRDIMKSKNHHHVTPVISCSPSLFTRRHNNNLDATNITTTPEVLWTLKPNVHVRCTYPPPMFRKRTISAIRSADVGQLLQVSGTVIRTGTVSERPSFCTQG